MSRRLVHRTGVFDMGPRGLMEVTDPSEALIGDRTADVPGTVLYPALDGRRPLLVEIQALAVPTTEPRGAASRASPPRGSIKSWPCCSATQPFRSTGRMFTPVPWAESGSWNPPLTCRWPSPWPRRCRGFGWGGWRWGEVGLTGELRASPQGDRRRGEAGRLGVERILGPGPHDGSLVDALAAVGIADGRRTALVAAG